MNRCNLNPSSLLCRAQLTPCAPIWIVPLMHSNWFSYSSVYSCWQCRHFSSVKVSVYLPAFNSSKETAYSLLTTSFSNFLIYNLFFNLSFLSFNSISYLIGTKSASLLCKPELRHFMSMGSRTTEERCSWTKVRQVWTRVQIWRKSAEMRMGRTFFTSTVALGSFFI